MKTPQTAYRVGDLDRSIEFYKSIGFREVGRVPIRDESILVMFNLPGDGEVPPLRLGR
jgi:lactoylglutathione lyase